MMRTIMGENGQKKKRDKRHVMRLLLDPFDLISPDALLRFFCCSDEPMGMLVHNPAS